MSRQIYLVDAFAEEPFTGNPAAVCPLAGPADEAWMQALAMEMNQAETAYFWPSGEGYELRWFTPAIEVDLCGHATLASAHVLFTEAERTPIVSPSALSSSQVRGEVVRFATKSGELVCRAAGEEIEMDFPNEAPSAIEPFDVSAALGVEPVWFGANRMDWFIALESEEAVRGLSPDFRAVAALGKRGMIVTAQSSGRADFVSRFFAPHSGIDEDPVTGSAHCALGPYWSERLGKKTVVGYQASKRGGYVTVEVRGQRVGLRGKARTVLRGMMKDEWGRGSRSGARVSG